MAKSAARGSLRRKCGEQSAPVFGRPHLERLEREAVTGGVLLGDQTPAAVLDRHPGFIAHRLKADLDLGGLIGAEGGLAPAESEAFAWNPSADAADLESGAIGQIGDQAAGIARLEAQLAITMRRQLEEPVGSPPQGDLLGENVKGFLGRGFHAKRDDDF